MIINSSCFNLREDPIHHLNQSFSRWRERGIDKLLESLGRTVKEVSALAFTIIFPSSCLVRATSLRSFGGVSEFCQIFNVVSAPYSVLNAYQALKSDEPCWVKISKFVHSMSFAAFSLSNFVSGLSVAFPLVSEVTSWLPPVKAVLCGFGVFGLVEIVRNHNRIVSMRNQLTRLEDEALKNISAEDASLFFSIPKRHYQDFVELLEKNPVRTRSLLSKKIQQKIVIERVRLVASAVSLISIAVFIAMTFTPLAPAAWIALYLCQSTLSLISCSIKTGIVFAEYSIVFSPSVSGS